MNDNQKELIDLLELEILKEEDPRKRVRLVEEYFELVKAISMYVSMPK